MSEIKDKRYTLVFRKILQPSQLKQLGCKIHYIGNYTPIVQASLTSSQLKQVRNLPHLLSIQEEQPFSLPYYKVNKIVSYKDRLVIQNKVVPQILPWNIARVIGNKRVNNGEGIRVGVLDTGIDYTHPDLKDNVKGGINIIAPHRPPYDDNGHGTHIAGVIGALNNHIGVVGVAPKVSLYAIKVLNAMGNGVITDLIKGIEWAIARRMHIINVSISGGRKVPLPLVKAIQAAVRHGIIVVAAAGNSGNMWGKGDTVEIPARLPSVISVAALNFYNRREYYSATGKIDIAAPGSRILSTYSHKRYAILSGTSMATAHVTGALAIYRKAYPQLSSQQLKQVLFKRAIDLPPKGKDPYTGVGLVQVKIS